MTILLCSAKIVAIVILKNHDIHKFSNSLISYLEGYLFIERHPTQPVNDLVRTAVHNNQMKSD